MKPALSEEALAACLTVLEAIDADRALLSGLDRETRERLLTAAGRVSRPERAEQRKLAKAFRRSERQRDKASDEALFESTGIREGRRAAVFLTPALSGSKALPPPKSAEEGPELSEPRKCYVCKAEFRRLHFFYDQMCGPCGDLNHAKRSQTAELFGRVALITGARVKIGYQAAILLLRSGARVVVTTRFPRDAAMRYARESDYEEWKDRLSIYGLDLRHTPSIERLAAHLSDTLPSLDFLLHNACQTVRRPPGFYAHLTAAEEAPGHALEERPRALLEGYESWLARDGEARADRGVREPARLSQAALVPEDKSLAARFDLFPSGRLDQDLQQVDLRPMNSWRLTLAEVPTVELLEVQLVNAIAPFVLTARLKPLMLRTPTRDKHVVNVSAMEGQFYREHKTDKHPHTNMAKAALNMLTRTSAADYVKDGIHMNSVDTGWVTDEDPAAIAERKVEEHGFHPPLDIVDGAARICDPIFSGFSTGEHAWGQFFKDYAPTRW